MSSAPSWAPSDGMGSGSNGSGAGGGAGVPGGGAAAVPGASTPAAGNRRGGMPLDFRRGKTSQRMLEIEWAYPVWKAAADGRKDHGTVAVEIEQALPVERAF